MLARNPWSIEFGRRVAFADLAGRQISWTGDRTEFLGRNGTLDQPAGACQRRRRSPTGSAPVSIPAALCKPGWSSSANDTAEIVFFLGETATEAEARSLLADYRTADLDSVLGAVARLWDDALGTVQVTTPDRSWTFC